MKKIKKWDQILIQIMMLQVIFLKKINRNQNKIFLKLIKKKKKLILLPKF